MDTIFIVIGAFGMGYHFMELLLFGEGRWGFAIFLGVLVCGFLL